MDPCQVLDISNNASLNEARASYLDLVQVWHPDRFSNNEKLKIRAQKKTVELNLAFERLKLEREKKHHASSETYYSEDFVHWGYGNFKPQSPRRPRHTSPGASSFGHAKTQPKMRRKHFLGRALLKTTKLLTLPVFWLAKLACLQLIGHLAVAIVILIVAHQVDFDLLNSVSLPSGFEVERLIAEVSYSFNRSLSVFM